MISEIYKYSIANDSLFKVLNVSFDNGKVMAGKWTEIEGKYYFFTTYQGAYLKGTFLEFDPVIDSITKIFDFDELKNPQGSLMAHDNGNYYGVAQRGGDNNLGSIFKLDPKGDDYEKLIEFTEELGTAPTGESIIASDGCIYGFARVLGAFGKGSIYKYDPSINKLEAIYYFNPQSEFMYSHERGYRLKEINHKLYFMMVPNETIEERKGYLMSFDLETFEMRISIDFHQSKLNRPIAAISEINNQYYGLTLNDTVFEIGGIIKLNEDLSEIETNYQIIHDDNAVNGQNPIWLCQAGDGDIYGITAFGGENNAGVLFAIDSHTEEMRKLMDMSELGNKWSVRNESFLLENGNILGFMRLKENNNWQNLHAFEFNPFLKEFKQVFIFPDSLEPRYKIKMNSGGNIYYSNGYPEYNAFELNLKDYSIHYFELLCDSNIRNICEGEPDIYYGSNQSNILRWNKQTNEIDSVFNVHYYGYNGIGSIREDIFVDKSGKIYSAYIESEYRPAWLVSFTYDLNVDSVYRRSFLGKAFYARSYKDFVEYDNGRYLILGQFNKSKEIEILDQQTGIIREIALEKSPYFIDYYWDTWNGWDIDGGNAPFSISPSIGLIKVRKIDNQNYWIGNEDSIWTNQNNWHKAKLPLGEEHIIISQSAKHFPYFDKLIEVSDVLIEENAIINIASNGALSCDILTNNGEIYLFGNQDERASLIFEETANNGKIIYSYQADKSMNKILSIPVKELAYSSFDSLKVWNYLNKEWKEIEDTSSVLDCHHIYKFQLDSMGQKSFIGEPISDNMVFNFTNSGLTAIPNPYTASFNWDEINLSNLSHQALYRFNEEDSTFSSYIDGLGNGAPLIQPLDVVWVYAKPYESVELETDHLIHAVNTDSIIPAAGELVLKASGETGYDFTYIRFNEHSTASFDPEFDARKIILTNNSRPSVFTYADTSKLSINQLPDTTMLNLAVRSGTTANYTLGIEKLDQFDFVVLEDLILHKKTNLLEEDYTFKYFTSDGNYPFKLYFQPWVLEPLEESDIEMYYYPESIVVQSRKQIKIAEITFFDLAGRVAGQYVVKNFFRFEKPVDLPTGHYVVQLRTSDLIVNKKILVRK